MVFSNGSHLMRNYKRVIIEPYLVPNALMGKCKLLFEGLPSDTTIKYVHYSEQYMGWQLVLEHPSFPEVPQDEMIPIVNCKFTYIELEPKIKFT